MTKETTPINPGEWTTLWLSAMDARDKRLRAEQTSEHGQTGTINFDRVEERGGQLVAVFKLVNPPVHYSDSGKRIEQDEQAYDKPILETFIANTESMLESGEGNRETLEHDLAQARAGLEALKNQMN